MPTGSSSWRRSSRPASPTRPSAASGGGGRVSAGTQARGDLRNYAIVTGAYWVDTITDGAIRLLVLFYFDQLGYSPFALASLFLFYEIFGIVTNLVGGWLAARLGLKATLLDGPRHADRAPSPCWPLVPQSWLIVPYVMAAPGALRHREGPHQDELEERRQARRPGGRPGCALPLGRDPHRLEERAEGCRLLRRRAAAHGDRLPAAPSCSCSASWPPPSSSVLALMRGTLGRVDRKAKFTQMFSNNRAVNVARAARASCCSPPATSGSSSACRSSSTPSSTGASGQVGGFLAVWVIGYGIVQASAPARLAPQPARGAERRHRDPAGVPARRVPGRHRDRATRGSRPDDHARRRPYRLRHRLRDELRRPLAT